MKRLLVGIENVTPLDTDVLQYSSKTAENNTYTYSNNTNTESLLQLF